MTVSDTELAFRESVVQMLELYYVISMLLQLVCGVHSPHNSYTERPLSIKSD